MSTTIINIDTENKSKPELDRSQQIREDVGEKQNKFLVQLKDIDQTIVDYYNNYISPQVEQGGNLIKVPLKYMNAEKWYQMKKLGTQLDSGDRIQPPIIVFKRSTVARDEQMPIDKLYNVTDGDLLYATYDRGWTKDNAYTNFNLRNSVTKKKELQIVVVPDFVTINYDFQVITSFQEQNNEIIQQFIYADMKYWISNKKFRWKGEIQNINTSIDMSETDDRVVKSEFQLVIQAYLLLERFGKEITNKRKVSNHTLSTMFKESITNLDL